MFINEMLNPNQISLIAVGALLFVIGFMCGATFYSWWMDN